MVTVYIYMIDFRNKGGDGIYIGATTNYDKRISTHLRHLELGNHQNPDIQYWYDELGPESIRLRPLCEKEVETIEELNRLEEQYMNWAVELHGRKNVLNYYLKSHKGSFMSAFRKVCRPVPQPVSTPITNVVAPNIIIPRSEPVVLPQSPMISFEVQHLGVAVKVKTSQNEDYMVALIKREIEDAGKNRSRMNGCVLYRAA